MFSFYQRLHHRTRAHCQQVHLCAEGQEVHQLRRLHRRHHRGDTQRVQFRMFFTHFDAGFPQLISPHPFPYFPASQSHRSLARGHHLHDQVRRLGHRPRQTAGKVARTKKCNTRESQTSSSSSSLYREKALMQGVCV